MDQGSADRRDRHKAWLETFGFSAEDWQRIKAHADEVRGLYMPAALSDLSVPIRVGACPPDEANRFNGRILGSYRGRMLLYWPMHEREQEEWARTLRLQQIQRPSAGKNRFPLGVRSSPH